MSHHHDWKTIHTHHYGWDNSLEPSQRITPGETLNFEILDAGGGQFSRQATLETLAALDFGKVNPVTGPIFIEGAEPGDALEVNCWTFAHPVGVGRQTFPVLACSPINSKIRI